MRIYRLHEQKDVKRGPFQNWRNGFGRHAIEHLTPQAYRAHISPGIWEAFLVEAAYCAWCSASKMRDMLVNPRRWPDIFRDMAVSIIEVEHGGYCILPDGQVLFTWDSATIVQTITDANELADLAEQEN